MSAMLIFVTILLLIALASAYVLIRRSRLQSDIPKPKEPSDDASASVFRQYAHAACCACAWKGESSKLVPGYFLGAKAYTCPRCREFMVEVSSDQKEWHSAMKLANAM